MTLARLVLPAKLNLIIVENVRRITITLIFTVDKPLMLLFRIKDFGLEEWLATDILNHFRNATQRMKYPCSEESTTASMSQRINSPSPRELCLYHPSIRF